MQKQDDMQQGRTLLEMISILVVIGILLISGILGYSFVLRQWKKQESVKQISELSVKYRLRPVKAEENGQVPLKTIVPDKTVDQYTMETPDEGRVQLSNLDNDESYSIIVQNTWGDTCQDYLEKGDYEAVLYIENSRNFNKEDLDGNEQYIALGKDLLRDWDKLTPQEKAGLDSKIQNMTKKEIVEVLCKENEGRIYAAALVWGDKCPSMGASYWYSGKCWKCPSGQTEDRYGNCCATRDMNNCKVCNDKANNCKVSGCPGPGKMVCDQDDSHLCVECVNDSNCDCRTDGKTVCSNHKCVECKIPGERCQKVSGEKGYCTSQHTCEPCDTAIPGGGIQWWKWDSTTETCQCHTPLLKWNDVCPSDANCCDAGNVCYSFAGADSVCTECVGDLNAGSAKDCGELKPLCNSVFGSTAKKCEACPSEGKKAGDACYSDRNGLCGCDSEKGLTCGAENKCVCPSGIWNVALQRCTECQTNVDCAGRPDGKTICGSEGICECPTNTYPDANGQCLKCEPDTQNGCSAPLPWCKSATVEAKTCVECLESAHCAGRADGKNICGANNTCECPVGKHPNASGVCVECETDDECVSRPDGKHYCNLDVYECSECPKNAPYKVDGKCLQCEPKTQNRGCSSPLPWCKSATVNSKECKVCFVAEGTTYGCDVDERIVCDESANSGNGACVCPEGKFWNGSHCVDCLLNNGENGEGACGSDKPVCDKNGSWTCGTCPEGKFWNVKAGKCTTCLVNHGKGYGECPTDANPVCNEGTDDWTCSPCSAGAEWNGQECQKVCVSLFSKARIKNKEVQTTETGCCAENRLIRGTVNALFKGYKYGETVQYACCADGDEVLGDSTKTNSSCCPKERVFTNAKGVKSCCSATQVPTSEGCCNPAQVYEEAGVKKCCTGTLASVSDRIICCPRGTSYDTTWKKCVAKYRHCSSRSGDDMNCGIKGSGWGWENPRFPAPSAGCYGAYVSGRMTARGDKNYSQYNIVPRGEKIWRGSPRTYKGNFNNSYVGKVCYGQELGFRAGANSGSCEICVDVTLVPVD